MKLGGYGAFRVAIFLMPEAAHEFSWIFIILTSISVVYGAFGAVAQKDLKYINAYSSVSHCGCFVRRVNDESDSAERGSSADGFSRIDDSTFLCPDRDDIRTNSYPYDKRDGRT